jgi:hypothetical protein
MTKPLDHNTWRKAAAAPGCTCITAKSTLKKAPKCSPHNAVLQGRRGECNCESCKAAPKQQLPLLPPHHSPKVLHQGVHLRRMRKQQHTAAFTMQPSKNSRWGAASAILDNSCSCGMRITAASVGACPARRGGRAKEHCKACDMPTDAARAPCLWKVACAQMCTVSHRHMAS